MISTNVTPRGNGAQRRSNASADCSTTIRQLIPYPQLHADYIALAALLCRPHLAGPHVHRLSHRSWARGFHRSLARVLIGQFTMIGRPDLFQVRRVLRESDVPIMVWRLELATLSRVAEFLHPGIVGWAVTELAERRRRRGAA